MNPTPALSLITNGGPMHPTNPQLTKAYKILQALSHSSDLCQKVLRKAGLTTGDFNEAAAVLADLAHPSYFPVIDRCWADHGIEADWQEWVRDLQEYHVIVQGHSAKQGGGYDEFTISVERHDGDGVLLNYAKLESPLAGPQALDILANKESALADWFRRVDEMPCDHDYLDANQDASEQAVRYAHWHETGELRLQMHALESSDDFGRSVAIVVARDESHARRLAGQGFLNATATPVAVKLAKDAIPAVHYTITHYDKFYKD